ncbi:MAG TPA: hypothetical protein VKV22_07765 [Rhodanobacteraceae bacterium]|nr:hypothetical protein [Rhodanobacteraceae bacterium]
MKHLSLCLTVLLLGGVPLAAAAVDYGPNSILLAAENTAPQLPGAPVRSGNAIPKPDMMAADAEDGGGASDAGAAPIQQRVAPSASTPRANQAPHSPGPSASNKPHAPAAQPVPVPFTPSWQSLLPGSIQ